MGVECWAEVALGSRMGWGSHESRAPSEGEGTECHLETPKVEAGEEEDEIVLTHRDIR